MARLEDPAAFRAWIYRIARDRAYRELRRRRKAPRSSEGLEVVAAEEPAALYAAEDVQRVYERLDRLEPHHREVLVLRFIEDMSYEDMARVIDCPLGTVRSRIHYAKEALRRAIGRKN
jgi:RNA polymerase sigma-70 factor (ECF subfamily)